VIDLGHNFMRKRGSVNSTPGQKLTNEMKPDVLKIGLTPTYLHDSNTQQRL